MEWQLRASDKIGWWGEGVGEWCYQNIAWIPAAIGSVAPDTARLQGFAGQHHNDFGVQVRV